jgi:hypothetical protein
MPASCARCVARFVLDVTDRKPQQLQPERRRPETGRIQLKINNATHTENLTSSGRKGLPDAINAVWELTTVQACIIYLIRNTFRYASRTYCDQIARDLRPVYTAATEADALAITKLCQTAWTDFVPFLDYATWRSARSSARRMRLSRSWSGVGVDITTVRLFGSRGFSTPAIPERRRGQDAAPTGRTILTALSTGTSFKPENPRGTLPLNGRRSAGRLGGLDQHPAHLRPAGLADPTVHRCQVPGLAHLWFYPT